MSEFGKTSIIHPGVHLGNNANVGEFSEIGVCPAALKEAAPATSIGDNAIIRSHGVIYAGTSIGRDFQMGHQALVREFCEIGNNVSVGSQSVVEHHVTIGNGVRIHSQAFVPEYCVLEDGAWLGPRACLTNSRYPASQDAKDRLQGVRVGRNARIGANVTILPGITVGEEALVGAGAVVVKDVLPRSVVVGNPASQINSVDQVRYSDDLDFSPYK